MTNDKVIKLAVDCGAVISRTLSYGAQTRVEFSRETLDFYTAAIEKLTEERVRAECTTSEAVAFWLVECFGDCNLLNNEKDADYWVAQYKIDGGEPEVTPLYTKQKAAV